MNDSLSFIDRYYRPVILGVILIGVGFILWVIITAVTINLDKGTYVTFNFAPTEAVITIDGKDYKTGTHEFKPGKYTGEIHYDGFDSKTVEINVGQRSVASVTDYLLNQKEGLLYFEKSAADIAVLENITGDEAVANFLTAYHKKYAIMDELPLDASFDNRAETGFPSQDLVSVKIENGNSHEKCNGTLCLLIVGKKVSNKKVKEVLSEKGYQIEDYEVIYEKE